MQFEKVGERGSFRARGDGYALLVNGTETILKLKLKAEGQANSDADRKLEARSAWMKMALVGAATPRRVQGLEPSITRSHYLHGNDPRYWQTNVPNFARVKYEGVYPGIDLVWYGNQRNLEYDFLVAPGVDSRQIRMRFEGVDQMMIDSAGNLVLRAGGGELQLRKPQAWQEFNGQKHDVACDFRIGKTGAIEFRVGAYDKTRALVIDPVLTYSSLIGGANSDQGLDVAVDAQGAAYLTGRTFSTDFPVVNPLQANSAKPDTDEVFVTKINPAGSAIVYSTYLGGDGNDTGSSIAVDATGSVSICGYTDSTNFPTTANAPQRTKAGLVDSFVARLSSSGSALVYSTLLGGNSVTQAVSLAVDATGNTYVVGQSDSTDFPSLNLINVRQGSSLYRSADGGANWIAFGNGMPAVQITVMAVDPKNPAIIYAGGRWGIYKSTDGGANWTRLASYNVGVSNIVIDPNTTSTLYLTFEGSGLLKSTNGGVSFDAPFNYPPLVSGITAFALDPKTPTTLYAGGFDGMFKSTDSGTNWVEVNDGLITTGFVTPPSVNGIAVSSIDSFILYISTSRGAFKSTMGGQSWSAISSLRGPSYNFAIDPTNSQIVYAGTRVGSGVQKTTDGGSTWIAVNNGLVASGQNVRVNALVVDPKATSTVYAATFGFGVFKTTDGGANWASLNNGLSNRNVFSLLLDPMTSQLKLAGTTAGSDTFAAKLNSTGTQWSYFRMLGGIDADAATAVAVDASGAAYLTGTTNSANFPTMNAVQPAYAGNTDGFVMKLNAMGQMVYSTYLGGEASDQSVGIGLDQTGTIVIAGTTMSRNFPLVSPLRSTAAVNPVGAATNDGFITKLNPQGTAWSYSTFFGGTSGTTISALTVAPNGEVFLAGISFSADFPVMAPVQPTPLTGRGGFVSQLNSTGSGLIFSSFFGTSTTNTISAMTLDSAGNLYLTASGNSAIFPTIKPIPLPGTNRGTDVLVAKISEQAADLAIAMASRPNPVKVNNNLAFDISVTNNGNSATTGVVVTNVLPTGVNLISADASQGSCSGNQTITCNLGNLAVGARAGITILVVPTIVATISNRASVTSDLGDPNTANNSVELQTRVVTLPSIYGRVLMGTGQGVSDVTMMLAGGQKPAVVTGSDGSYQFGELTEGATYTVTPLKSGFAFSPASREFGNLSSDQRADFIAIGCSLTVAPTTSVFAATGGGGSVNVAANDSRCLWTARSNDSWIRLATPNGNGTSTVSFSVEPTTSVRRGTIVVAGQVITIRQEFNACSAPSFQSVPASLGLQAQTGLTPLVAADFNGDKITDILVRSPEPLLVVRYGNGAGGFSSQTEIVISATTVMPPSGDFNRDGRLDIVLFDPNFGTISTLLNNGSNGFSPGTQFPLPPNPRLLTAGDFTGDGIPDYLVSGSNGIRLLAGNGDIRGGFNDIAASLPVSSNGVFFNSGEFSGDGNLDLLVYTPPPDQGGPATIRVLFGDGRGAFTAASITQALTNLQARIEFADFNNDGKTDIALLTVASATAQGLVVAYARSDGRFGSGTAVTADVLLPSPELQGLKAGDVNGDGRFDLIAQTRNTDQTLLFVAQNDSSFASPIDLPVPTSRLPHVGDFNGDGAPDILLTTLTNEATLLSNRGFCPSAEFLTVTSAANFKRLRVSGDSIASAFGSNLAASVVVASTTPLPTTLGGTTLRIRDSAGREADAPLFFVSPQQINWLVPLGLAEGAAVVSVLRGGSAAATGVVELASVNPGLLSADATGTGLAAAVVLRVKADGSQVYEPVAQFNQAQNRFDPVPIDVSNPAEQVFVLFFGTGVRGRTNLVNVIARVGGEVAEVNYAGDQGSFAGLDQINVRLLPALAGKGDVTTELTVDGKLSNPVRLRIR
ncbi:MAG: VCBS repeat-containing protein [Acidobacteria bacterium]|nr:VCBS repeat-containing protein [Acidobacteriota bacterium]